VHRLAATLRDGLARESQLYLRHREGHRVPVRVRVRPLWSDSGEIVAAVETFDNVADHVAALEEIRELKDLVYVDSLTGIANRRFLEETLSMRMDEAARSGWGLGVVMMDVDGFKVVNDNYGHKTGDRLLQMIARTLRGAARSYDMVGRWGGDEFMTILPNTNLSDLAASAERYRMLVGKSGLSVGDRRLTCSVSVGATMVLSREELSSAVARTDSLLYESKHRGGNEVTCESGLDVMPEYDTSPSQR